jgi:hypothetical protein
MTDTQKTVCPTCQGKKMIAGECECSPEWKDCQCTPDQECPTCKGTGVVESE